jgi:small-conductance mechanosensitive channel
VTNWTLDERRVRVKIPVGVAYGTDTTKVLEILMNCAAESPMVLSKPSPTALFLAFGENSLDFELRVWIPDVNDRLLVLSALNQDILNELQIAEIEIPFPQRDLHLRSITDTAAASLK